MKIVPTTMGFRSKLLAQKIFSYLPYRLYRFFVEKHPKLAEADYNKYVNYYISNCEIIRPYGLDLNNNTILESGTGAALVDPITFYLAGARKTYTFDIRLHVNPKHVWGHIDAYESNLHRLAEVMGLSYDSVYSRWKTIKDIRDSDDVFDVPKITQNRVFPESKNFHNLLDALNVQILESRSLPGSIPKNSVDIFFSNSVIMRPKEEILRLLITEVDAVMKDDSLIWHKIDTRDISWLYDKSISRYNYLKYSEFWHRVISSEAYSNQNRLRQSDYIKLFKNIGFEIIYLRSKRPENYKLDLSRIKINKRFNHYDIEDLSITNFILFGGRGKYSKSIIPKYELIEFPGEVEDQFL